MNQWYQTLGELTGVTIRQASIESMEEVIQNQITDVTPYEINEAVYILAEAKRTGKIKYKISGNNIISQIIYNRYQDRNPTIDPQTKIEKIVNQLKNKIINARDNYERWEIICCDKGARQYDMDDKDVTEKICKPLLTFTSDKFKDFARPLFRQGHATWRDMIESDIKLSEV